MPGNSKCIADIGFWSYMVLGVPQRVGRYWPISVEYGSGQCGRVRGTGDCDRAGSLHSCSFGFLSSLPSLFSLSFIIYIDWGRGVQGRVGFWPRSMNAVISGESSGCQTLWQGSGPWWCMDSSAVSGSAWISIGVKCCSDFFSLWLRFCPDRSSPSGIVYTRGVWRFEAEAVPGFGFRVSIQADTGKFHPKFSGAEST